MSRRGRFGPMEWLLEAAVIWRVLSIAIFAGTVAVVVGITLLVPLDDDSRRPQGTSVYQVGPGESLDLVIPAEITNLSIRTFALVPPETDDVSYQLDVAWLDPSGAVRLRRTVVEQSRLSWFPVFPGTPMARLFVEGSPQRVADSRITTLAVKPFLPNGGVVRITPDANSRLIIEPRSEDLLDSVTLAHAMLAPRQSQIAHARDRMGVAWALLSEDDRRAGLASTTHPVRAKARASRAHMWIRPNAERAGAREIRLAPRMTLALNVQGPVRVRVSGAGPLQNLTASLVTDGLTAAVELTPQDAAPLGLSGELEAHAYRIDAVGPASLILGNTGDVDVRFVASIDKGTPMDVFAFTPTTPLLDPDAPPTPGAPVEASTLIGPEVRPLRAFRLWAGAPDVLRLDTWGFDRDDKVRVLVWPVLDGPDDVRPRRITIVGRGDDEHVVFVQHLDVPAMASTFDQPGDILAAGARSTPSALAGRFIGEPVTLYARGDPAVTQLSVGADDEVLAQLGIDGPLTGDERLYPLPLGDANVRYRARPMRSWHTTPPSNEEALIAGGQVAKLNAMVRLEPRPAPNADNDGLRRRYQSLEPTPPEVERTAVVWLLPPAPPVAPDLVVYCRVEPATDPRTFLFDPRPLDGRLASFLIAPAGVFGASFSIDLDGSLWRHGVIRQRMTQLAAPREPRHTTVRVDAPPGSALFLRTVAGTGACATMLRPFRAYPLAPHARIDFRVDKVLDEQWLVVGSLAHQAGALGVVIHANPASLASSSIGFTELARVVPTPAAGMVAERLGAPDVTLTVRPGVPVKLESDLKHGDYRVTVENASSSLAFVYAVVELVDPLTKTPAGPQFLSTSPEDVP